MKLYRHWVAETREIAGTCESGGTRTYDRDAMTVLFGARGGSYTVLSCPVGNEALELTYGNRLTLYSPDTFALTLALLRAHASADSRQCGSSFQHLCCFEELFTLNVLDERRYVDIHRATLHT